MYICTYMLKCFEIVFSIEHGEKDLTKYQIQFKQYVMCAHSHTPQYDRSKDLYIIRLT